MFSFPALLISAFMLLLLLLGSFAWRRKPFADAGAWAAPFACDCAYVQHDDPLWMHRASCPVRGGDGWDG